MKKRNFFIGPGAASLLLVVVVVSMSVLGLLAMMSARSDARLAERSVTYTQAQYGAMAESERSLAALDAVLLRCGRDAADDASYLAALEAHMPSGMILDGRTVRWTEDTGAGKMLYCAADVAPLGDFPRCAWTEHLFVTNGTDDLF